MAGRLVLVQVVEVRTLALQLLLALPWEILVCDDKMHVAQTTRENNLDEEMGISHA